MLLHIPYLRSVADLVPHEYYAPGAFRADTSVCGELNKTMIAVLIIVFALCVLIRSMISNRSHRQTMLCNSNIGAGTIIQQWGDHAMINGHVYENVGELTVQNGIIYSDGAEIGTVQPMTNNAISFWARLFNEECVYFRCAMVMTNTTVPTSTVCAIT